MHDSAEGPQIRLHKGRFSPCWGKLNPSRGPGGPLQSQDGGESDCGRNAVTYSEYTVTGETVNLASRLTDAAGPGEILISDGVRRPLAERLDCSERGALTVKGFAEPVAA